MCYIHQYQTLNEISLDSVLEPLSDMVMYRSLPEQVNSEIAHATRNVHLPSLTHTNTVYLLPTFSVSSEKSLRTVSSTNLLYAMINRIINADMIVELTKLEALKIIIKNMGLRSGVIKIDEINQLLAFLNYGTREILKPSISLISNILLSLRYPLYPFTYKLLSLTFPIRAGFKRNMGYRALIIELINEIYESVFLRIRYVTASYRFLLELQRLVARMRYVSSGDIILQNDHNLFVDACELFLRFATQLRDDLFADDPEVNDKLLDVFLAVDRLRRVYGCDMLTADDHNSVVEAVLKIREFIKVIREKIGLST